MFAKYVIEFLVAKRKPPGRVEMKNRCRIREEIRIKPPVKDVIAASDMQFPYFVSAEVLLNNPVVNSSELPCGVEKEVPRGSQ
jgi:hypothetical protein